VSVVVSWVRAGSSHPSAVSNRGIAEQGLDEIMRITEEV
jgi:hypothetical protein